MIDLNHIPSSVVEIINAYIKKELKIDKVFTMDDIYIFDRKVDSLNNDENLKYIYIEKNGSIVLPFTFIKYNDFRQCIPIPLEDLFTI